MSKKFRLLKAYLVHIWQGILVGIGNIIPGVSGGTIALILGIYPRALRAIANLRWQTAKACLLLFTAKKEHRELFKREMGRIDAGFLAMLGAGAIFAVGSFSFLLSQDGYLLKYHKEATYSFFFGIVLLSVIFPYRLLKRKSWKELLAVFLGIVAVLSFTLTTQRNSLFRLDVKCGKTLNDGKISADIVDSFKKSGYALSNEAIVKIEKENARWLVDDGKNKQYYITIGGDGLLVNHLASKSLSFYFFAGVAAISAMILPGISGSLMLLLLGGYFEALRSIKIVLLALKSFLLNMGEFQLTPEITSAFFTLVVLATGCAVGIICFTRLIDYILRHYYNPTMAFLTGLIIGSLYGIWPFREVISSGESALYGKYILPEHTPESMVCLATFATGCIVVLCFYWYDKKMAHKNESESP